MVHPRTQISWLDNRTQQQSDDAISKLYQQFIEHEKPHGHFSMIDFEPGQMMIKDGFGWTELQSICRVEDIPGDEWLIMNPIICLSKFLILSKLETVPVYDGTDKVGFHGEHKYRFQVRPPEGIHGEDRIRIRDVPRCEGREFFMVNIKPSSDRPNTGYTVVTKSNFYTANGFSLWASTTLPKDEWSWK